MDLLHYNSDLPSGQYLTIIRKKVPFWMGFQLTAQGIKEYNFEVTEERQE